jgi:site-specific recombinase XerD/chaperonin cofactor prefoldin
MKKIDLIQIWIDAVAQSHSDSKGTAYNYRRFMEKFCNFIKKSPEDIQQDFKKMNQKEFRQYYGQLVMLLVSELRRKELAPNSINAHIVAIKSFFKYHSFDLGYVGGNRMKIRYVDRPIKREEIERILEASRPRDRAFFCMMAQSGLRPYTMVKLRLKHLEPDFSNGTIPCRIFVPENIAKGKYGKYLTFMCEESVRYLKAYFELERPNISAEDLIFTAHGYNSKGKPVKPNSFSLIFTKTLRQLRESGVLDYEQSPERKPSELKLYSLRKFFRNNLKARFQYCAIWMGHLSKLENDKHYIFTTDFVEENREEYMKNAMPYLKIGSYVSVQTEQEMLKKQEESNKQLEELTKNFNRLETQNQWLLDRLPPLRQELRVAYERNPDNFENKINEMRASHFQAEHEAMKNELDKIKRLLAKKGIIADETENLDFDSLES